MANVMLIEGWGLAGTGADYADFENNRKLAVLGWQLHPGSADTSITIGDDPDGQSRTMTISHLSSTGTDLLFRRASSAGGPKTALGFSTDDSWVHTATAPAKGGVGIGFSSTSFQGGWPDEVITVGVNRDTNGNLRLFEYDGTTYDTVYKEVVVPENESGFLAATRNWVEVVIDTGAAVAELWVNSSLKATLNLDLAYPSSPHLAAFIGRRDSAGGLNGTIPVGALYVADERLGRCQVITQRPSTDSAVEFSRPQGDSNASQVADPNGYDGDTTYVSSSTSGAEDLYGTTDPTGLTNERIHGVSVAVVGRKEDIGNRSITPVCAQGTTVAAGDPVTLEIGQYLGTQSVFSADPDTGLDWSLSGLNSSTFGVRLTD